jgi:hypothetical protein
LLTTSLFSCLQVHASALQWQAEGEVGIRQRLAAIIVHAADLGNGADEWPVSKLWAQWCNAGECLKTLLAARNYITP